MGMTVIPFGDPKAAKRWSGDLMIDTNKKSYFGRKFVGTDDNSIIQRKTELDSDAGDTISFDLSVQLRGKPVSGDNRALGTEEQLRFYTDQVFIDQLRHPVSAGGKMTRKRTLHDLRTVAKNRLSDYWSKYIDEITFVYLSGARGINQEYIEDQGYTGHAGNPIQAPDASHIAYGGVATSKATVATTDKMSRNLLEKVQTNCAMLSSIDPNNANLLPVNIDGEDHFVCLMSKYQEYDLRTESGAQGWLEINKALTTAQGKSNPIFMGGLGMINNIVLHSHERVIRFSDYGAGANVAAARALFMGRQAAVVAYGTAGGLRFSWVEEDTDYGNEPTVVAGTIIGLKKTRFNSRDFGVIAVDTAAAAP